jgi:diguanylate cyclase (GGDEF)-like protein
MARLLIVDDDAEDRALLARFLHRAGHETLEASSGNEALSVARAEQPELILSDVLMPTMDGYEFVRHVRADPGIARTPVIFHTAVYLEPDAAMLATSCQVDCVLVKGCPPSQLLSAVSDALTRIVEPQKASLTGRFSGEHLRLLTNKLAEKVDELEAEKARVLQLNRTYAVLSGINALIVRTAEREELCREACRLAVDQGHFKVAWIGLKDPEVGRLVPVTWAGDYPDLLRFTQALATGDASGEDIVSRTLRDRTSNVCNDLDGSFGVIPQRDQLLAQGLRALVVLPLVSADQATGCFVLVSDTANCFDETEMRLLAELAGDISYALDHIEKAEKLHHLAYYDPLTGLANRELFQERVGQYIEAARKREGELAIIVLDLERFETISDTFGRHVGDQLLRHAAERLIPCIGNPRYVARIGSGQLAAVVPDVGGDRAVLRDLDTRWHQWLGAAFQVDGRDFQLSAKAGIALFPHDGAEAQILLRNATTALKKAKSTPDRYAFYTQNLSDSRAEWLALESKLRRALEHREFVLHYQPKVDVVTRRLVGVEALIRWQSRELGLVPPMKFIPLLEETGLIADVGVWVLEQALRDHARWEDATSPVPRIAINVSTLQLAREDFVRSFEERLKGAGPRAGIDIEVTESLIMTDVAANIAKLEQIRSLGVHIAIDDFGTGYSSLGYLAKLPVSVLKIDRSFVSAMLQDASAMTLVSTMISLAHALKLSVVAEGVETEEQAAVLGRLQCDQMQGYLIGKPVPFEAIGLDDGPLVTR